MLFDGNEIQAVLEGDLVASDPKYNFVVPPSLQKGKIKF